MLGGWGNEALLLRLEVAPLGCGSLEAWQIFQLDHRINHNSKPIYLNGIIRMALYLLILGCWCLYFILFFWSLEMLLSMNLILKCRNMGHTDRKPHLWTINSQRCPDPLENSLVEEWAPVAPKALVQWSSTWP